MTAEAIGLDAGSHPGLRDGVERLRKRIAGRLQLGLRSKVTRYGLCRELAAPLTLPSAKIPIAVRPLEERDLPALFAAGQRSGRPDGSRRAAGIHRQGRASRLRRGRPRAPTRRATCNGCSARRTMTFIARLKGFPPLERGPGLARERLYAAGLSRPWNHVGRDGADRRTRGRDRRTPGVHLCRPGQHRLAEGLPARGLQSGCCCITASGAASACSGATVLRPLPDADPRRTAKF